MTRKLIPILAFFMSLTSITQISFGQAEQADTSRRGAVRIFLDCSHCDMNYIRQEIPYINYVRDVKEAQVYILETNQNTGSGGNQYTYNFQGQSEFGGMCDTLIYTSSPDQTSTIIREKRANMLKMGLMQYVAKTPLFNEIEISHNSDLEEEEVKDKWNNWVFELSTEPQYEAEEADKRLELRNSINISKVTPDIKLEIEFDQFYNREKFIRDVNTPEETSRTYITSEKEMNNLFVKSFGEHWSAGFRWNMGSSSRENYRFRTDFLPAVEYDIFPYSEATHRQLRLMYSAGYQYNNYVDTTIFNIKREGLGLHMIDIAYQIQKKWGSINLSLQGSSYFHDFSKNMVELNANVNIRIFKGLSVRIDGGIAHINDQLNLKKGDISEAERLLQLREIATKYRIEGSVELVYTFGSIYNNVVNPRFN